MSDQSRAGKLEELDRVFVDVSRFLMGQCLEYEVEISPKQFLLLRVLYEVKRSTVSELACILKLSNSATTIALNRLVKANYINRVRCEHDRRIVWVTLSEKGLPLIEGLIERRKQLMRELTENLSNEELDQITQCLWKIRECLK